MLRSVGATRRSGRARTRRQSALKRAAAAIRSASNLDRNTEKALREAAGEDFGFVCRHMIRNLPESSKLAQFLERASGRIRKDARTIAGAVKTVENCKGIRPELYRVLEQYLRASIRRFEIKRARGHDYTEYTVYRRAQVAADFCRFLEDRDVQSWREVMQRHFDAYCAARNREQGRKAATFLHFVHRTVPGVAKLQRPRYKRRPALEMTPAYEAQAEAVARLIAEPVDEEVVVGLFVTVYAQRISDCQKLHLSNFRLRDNRIQVRFAKAWMPLDRAVSERVLNIAPNVTANIHKDDMALFTQDPRIYGTRIRAICNLPVKQLRLGALAAIIRRGVTDRATLSALLGVSMSTIEYVERTMEWDLQSTVDPKIVRSRNRVIRGEA